MGELRPKVLLDIVDRERLDDIDKVLYDGTKRFIELHEPSKLSVCNSDDYGLKVLGGLFRSGYFSFTSHQGQMFMDYLRSLPDELLGVARDEELMGIVHEAESDGFHTSIPMTWKNARQMNDGLYEGAAQFEVTPPCLKIGMRCTQDEFYQKVENLATIVGKLETLHIKRARGE